VRSHKARIAKLEAKHASPADVIAWAELIGDDRAVIRYQDGRREEISADNIPAVKVYEGFSPDNWDKVAA
jgi:hypothetical protein